MEIHLFQKITQARAVDSNLYFFRILSCFSGRTARRPQNFIPPYFHCILFQVPSGRFFIKKWKHFRAIFSRIELFQYVKKDNFPSGGHGRVNRLQRITLNLQMLLESSAFRSTPQGNRYVLEFLRFSRGPQNQFRV